MIRLDRNKQAEKDIKLALELSPFVAKLNKLAGELYAKLGRKQAAIEALEIEPYDVRSSYGLPANYANTESCEIVQSMHDYMTGCQRGVGKTELGVAHVI